MLKQEEYTLYSQGSMDVLHTIIRRGDGAAATAIHFIVIQTRGTQNWLLHGLMRECTAFICLVKALLYAELYSHSAHLNGFMIECTPLI